MTTREIKEQILERKMFDALSYINKLERQNNDLLDNLHTIRHGNRSGILSTVYLSEYEIYEKAERVLNKYRS